MNGIRIELIEKAVEEELEKEAQGIWPGDEVEFAKKLMEAGLKPVFICAKCIDYTWLCGGGDEDVDVDCNEVYEESKHVSTCEFGISYLMKFNDGTEVVSIADPEWPTSVDITEKGWVFEYLEEKLEDWAYDIFEELAKMQPIKDEHLVDPDSSSCI